MIEARQFVFEADGESFRMQEKTAPPQPSFDESQKPVKKTSTMPLEGQFTFLGIDLPSQPVSLYLPRLKTGEVVPSMVSNNRGLITINVGRAREAWAKAERDFSNSEENIPRFR